MSVADFTLPPVRVVSEGQDATGRATIRLELLGVALPEVSYTAEELRRFTPDELQALTETAAFDAVARALRV